MSNLIHHSSSNEIIFKPLIEAANTKKLQNALDILFISGHTLSFTKEVNNFPCLISVSGPITDLDNSLEILSAKGSMGIKPVITSGLRMFLPTINIIAHQSEKLEDNDQFSMIVSQVIPKFQAHQQAIFQLFIQGTMCIPDLITPALFKTFIETRKNHIHCCDDEMRYERMISSLKKIGVIESQIQISICPKCANYQIILSKNPTDNSECPKCGTKWATIIFYSFVGDFGKLKFDSTDISLFISSYLKSLIGNEVMLETIDVYPNASYKTDSGHDVELDIHVPEFKLGIECKIYEDPLAPMTSSRLHSICGKLFPQIERYKEMEIERLAIVTNLPENVCSEIKNNLEKKMKSKKICLKLKVLPGDSNVLLSLLNGTVQDIVKFKNDTL